MSNSGRKMSTPGWCTFALLGGVLVVGFGAFASATSQRKSDATLVSAAEQAGAATLIDQVGAVARKSKPPKNKQYRSATALSELQAGSSASLSARDENTLSSLGTDATRTTQGGGCTVFSNQAEFEAFNEGTGKFLKGIEDFEETPPGFGVVEVDDPLCGGIPSNPPVFPNGIDQLNLCVQANTLGDAPVVPSPHGVNGLVFVEFGSDFGESSDLVLANYFHESLDIMFGDPVPPDQQDNHTSVGFDVVEMFGIGLVDIHVYNENNVEMVSVTSPADEGGLNFWGVSCPDTIGRINVNASAEGAQGVDNIQMWVGEDCAGGGCGDGTCCTADGEDCKNCEADCDACPSCGDGNVDPGEDCDPPGSLCANGELCEPDCTCPVLGACCLDDGCLEDQSEKVCDAQGGESQGEGTDCSACPTCGDGDCCIANGTPGCDDPDCCVMVCEIDPFCCDDDGGVWDSVCAQEAADLCEQLCISECGDCPTDADGDGSTGSADLPILLGAWGEIPDGAPQAVVCLDGDGDGFIGSADLPILLGAWGPCPCTEDADCPEGEGCQDGLCAPVPITGACCLFDQNNCIQTLPADCNGTFQGLGTVCGALQACCWPGLPGGQKECFDDAPICCRDTTPPGRPQGVGSTCAADPCCLIVIVRQSPQRAPQGALTVNVGQFIKLELDITPAPPGGTTYQWTVAGSIIKDYQELTTAPFGTTPMAPGDFQNQTIEFYWKPAANQVHPMAATVPRDVTVVVTFPAGAPGCQETVTFSVQRNNTRPTLQAEDWYAEYNHPEAPPPLCSGLPPTRILNEHACWHRNNAQRMCGNAANVPHGMAFFEFHRKFLSRFNSWRNTFGYPPHAEWDPGGAAYPAGVKIDHPGRNAWFARPRPGYLTCAGGGPASPCFNRANIPAYANHGELGWVTEASWHNGVHVRIGGDMRSTVTAPKDPLFWRFHTFVDQKIYGCRLAGCPGGCP